MDRQIRRYEGKTYRSQQGKRARRDIPEGLAPEPEEEVAPLNEIEDLETKVVRRKRFPMIARTVDDTITEMELPHHSFYLFSNVETGSHSVV